jgi:hypothetical protein
MTSAIDAEIAAERARHARRRARLQDKQRKEAARLDSRMLAILKAKLRPADLAAIEAQARAQLDRETAARSRRAREARRARTAPAEITVEAAVAPAARSGVLS